MATTKSYLCGSDFRHELGHTLDYFDSVDELKQRKSCWESCGIVAVYIDSEGEIVKSEEVVPGTSPV